jgi:hypothetical protein
MNARRLFAAVTAVLALGACSSDPAPTPPLAEPTGSATSAAPTGTASPSATAPASASASPSASPSATMTVAVYYLHDSGSLKLYREFRTVPRSAGVVRAAVDAMLHLAPLDPDYQSLWPAATTVRGVSISGTVATVDLSANARSRGTGSTAEAQSLQQLVYTVTAAAPSLTGVRLRFDGATKDTLWGHMDTRGTLTRAPAVDTLGAVWVTSPAQFARIGRTLRVQGVASVFEANVSWSLRRLGGGVIKTGFSTATEAAPARATWSATITIPASVTGDVVFTAWESSAKDGSVQSPDDKRFRIA